MTLGEDHFTQFPVANLLKVVETRLLESLRRLDYMFNRGTLVDRTATLAGKFW